MSKELTKEELTSQKDSMIRKFNDLLTDYIAASDSHLNKKASLISYWMNSFTQYIKTEEDFEPAKLKSYKRGDIIKLNFGFNVGSEYGGLHYAIVINNHNPRNSSVLTVIPLTSQKENAEVHPNDVFLGNEIYRNLKIKYDTISLNLNAEKEEISKMMDLFDSLMNIVDEKLLEYDDANTESDKALADARSYLNAAKELQNEWNEKSEKNAEATRQLEKIGTEINRMKAGSIALVDQITTVSKMRIYDPRNSRGVLSGIKLSPEALDKINEKLKELFIF